LSSTAGSTLKSESGGSGLANSASSAGAAAKGLLGLLLDLLRGLALGRRHRRRRAPGRRRQRLERRVDVALDLGHRRLELRIGHDRALVHRRYHDNAVLAGAGVRASGLRKAQARGRRAGAPCPGLGSEIWACATAGTNAAPASAASQIRLTPLRNWLPFEPSS
jgi:hypothetical protein